MKVAVVDYAGGNTQSVIFALERLGVHAELTHDEAVLRAADRVIFPGEGEASSAMGVLRARGLDRVLPTLTQPFLGVCLGMQLLGRWSAEGPEGGTELLGVLPFDVTRFPGAPGFKVPHMGWNDLHELRGPLFDGVAPGTYAYFVHGYRAPVGPWTSAVARHPEPFTAALRHRNFHATQFHVEKSGPAGARMLANFLGDGVLHPEAS